MRECPSFDLFDLMVEPKWVGVKSRAQASNPILDNANTTTSQQLHPIACDINAPHCAHLPVPT